jgi:hypothetical protein
VKNDKIYFEYVLRCIARIEKFVAGGKDEFMTKDIVQDAVLRNLHTLSESTQRVSSASRQAHQKNIGSKNDFRWRSHEITRMKGFSEAVFAFAVTLLVVSLEVPKTFEVRDQVDPNPLKCYLR